MIQEEKFRRRLSLYFSVIFFAFFLIGGVICWVIPPPRMVLPLEEPKPGDGHSWVVVLPDLPLSPWQRQFYRFRPDDGTEHDLILFEDGQPLPLSNQSYQDIRNLGGGRYSYSQDSLWFSTSRNDDPTGNGSVYETEIRTKPRVRVYKASKLALFFSLFGVVCWWLTPRIFPLFGHTRRWLIQTENMVNPWQNPNSVRVEVFLYLFIIPMETLNNLSFCR